jgi:hypothetical protein
MDFLFHTWPWYVSGFLIAVVMLLLNYFGKVFGVSSNLRTVCTILGAAKYSDFFNFDWKTQGWNLVVLAGAMLGGWFAVHFMSDPSNVQLHPATLYQLEQLGIDLPQGNLEPTTLFGNAVFSSPKKIIFLLIGGLFIGFGSRYAGGCTSGHAIAGISNLQRQSLKAVIGFFVGGLIMAHFIFPLIFS